MTARPVSVAAAVAATAAPRPPARRHEPLERRTCEPVRRDSWVAGGAWEGAWRCRLGRRELNELVLAARIYRERLWRTGDREGLFTEIGISMLEKLAAMARRTPRRLLNVSLSLWATLCGHSPDTINQQRKRLEEHGFLESQRRLAPTGERGRRGVQVKQVENVYRLRLPEAARRMLGRFGVKAPPPEDHVHQAREGRALADRQDQERRALACEPRRACDAQKPAPGPEAPCRPRLSAEQLAQNAAWHAERIAARQRANFSPERDTDNP